MHRLLGMVKIGHFLMAMQHRQGIGGGDYIFSLQSLKSQCIQLV